MTARPVEVTHLFPQNATQGNAAEVPNRSYAFAGGSSPNRNWVGPGLDPGTVGNVIQTDDPARPFWCFRKAMMVPTQPFTLDDVARCWNMGHQTGGGVGWSSGNATSQLAMDICSTVSRHQLPNGTIGQWDNNGVHHTKPYFQRSLNGGGVYEPGPAQGNPGGIDWYRGTTKHYETFEFDFDMWCFFEVVTQIMSDGSGFWTERVNGNIWINHYVGPLHLPGVSTQYYPNNAGTTGFETIEGAYEATNLQQEFIVYHTIMQAGKGATDAIARAACIADTPTRGLGDHSRPIPGGSFPASFSQVSGTTIDDAGFGGVAAPPPVVVPPPVVTPSPGTPPGFDSVVLEVGCGMTTTVAGELQATVPGAADSADTAVGVRDFGGSSGLAGRVYSRDIIRLDTGQTLTGNLGIFELLDAAGALVYELYLDSSRALWLWSPAGGLRSTSINNSTGFVVANDGMTNVRVEVSALANDSVIVRVNDTDKITLTGLSGATTTNQRSLRAGIDHYDGNSTSQVMITHGFVTTWQTTWLGDPAVPPPTPPPVVVPPPATPPPPAPPAPAPAVSVTSMLETALDQLRADLAAADITLADCNEHHSRLESKVEAVAKALHALNLPA